MLNNKIIKNHDYVQKTLESRQAIQIVSLLSRTNEHGASIHQDDRIMQANQWLKHPYAYVIKMIDWSNKLQTMAGVEHFEKEELGRMGKVLNETSLLFVDEQQAFTHQAVKKYPSLENVCEPLEGIMGSLFHILNTYKKLKTKEIYFNPEVAKPFNLENNLKKAAPLINALPTGNNYIGPLTERLNNMKDQDPEIKSFLKYMVQPAFINFQSTVPALQHKIM